MLLLAATHLGRYGDFGHPGHGHRPLRILLFVLFLVLIGTVIWLVVPETRRRRSQTVTTVATAGGPVPDTALEQLRMRYARSEITREEYLQIAQDLGGPAAP